MLPISSGIAKLVHDGVAKVAPKAEPAAPGRDDPHPAVTTTADRLEARSTPPQADAPAPDLAVHHHLQQQPAQRDAVYTGLLRTDPGLIYHLEQWQQADRPRAGAGTTVQPADWQQATGLEAVTANTPAQESRVRLDPALQAILQRKERLDALRERVAAGGPGAAAVAPTEADLRQAIEAELRNAATAGPRYPGDPLTAEQRMAGRAAQIKALAPGDAAFAALVDQSLAKVQHERDVKAAADQVKAVYESKGAVAAAQELEALTAAHPEWAAELIDASAGTLERVAKDLAAMGREQKDELTQAVTALAAAAERGGAASTARIAGLLAGAAGNSDFGDYAVGPRGNPQASTYANLDGVLADVIAAGGAGAAALGVATAEALRGAGRTKAADRVDQAVVNGVDRLRENFDDIQLQYAQREAQLQQDLAQFGPGLTAEQKAQYVQAYWADESKVPAGDEGKLPSNAEVRRRFLASDDQLAGALKAAAPTLERLARAGDENAGEVLLDGYEALARSPDFAQDSIDWMHHVQADPALFAQLDGYVDDDLAQRFSDGIASDALQSLAAQLTAQLAAASAEEQQNLIEKFLDKARQLDTTGGYLDDIETIAQLHKDLKEVARLRGLAPDDPERVKLSTYEGRVASRADDLLNGWSDMSKFGKTLAVVGLVVSLADTVESFRDGDIPAGVLAAIGTGKDATEIGLGILNVLGKGSRQAGLDAAGLGIDAAADAARLGKTASFAAHFLPLIGLGLDGVQLKDDISQLRTNPNFGEGVAALGTAVALAGDLVEFIPGPGTLLGGAIGAIGSVLHAIGGFLDGLFEGNEAADALRKRQLSYLAKLDIKGPEAEVFVDQPYLLALVENFGMRPEFVREWAAANAGDLSFAQENLLNLAATTAATYGFTGAKAERFFHDVLQASQRTDLDGSTDVWDTGADPFTMRLIVDGEGASAIQRMRAAQAAWFQQNMPDIYAEYFAPVPGAPDYAQPGYGSQVVVGYFDDMLALWMRSDPDIAGTAPNES